MILNEIKKSISNINVFILYTECIPIIDTIDSINVNEYFFFFIIYKHNSNTIFIITELFSIL